MDGSSQRRRASRRGFIRTATFGAAGMALAGATPAPASSGRRKVVDEQSFARLEEVGDGVWAVVSTPFGEDGGIRNLETLCNGGLVRGDDAVVAIDAFLQPAGAAWLAQQARRLTGRSLTHVVITHDHLDHSGGVAGYQSGAEGPEIVMAAGTRDLVLERYAEPREVEGEPFGKPRARVLLPTQVLLDESRPVPLDLGGRSLTLRPLSGHTPSDLAVEVDDPPVIFAGDLVWGDMFPNFVDGIPSAWRTSALELLSDPKKVIVTGHGSIERADRLREPFLALLDAVEGAARAGKEQGQSAAEAAAGYTAPAAVAAWRMFNPGYPEVAVKAWYREWGVAPEGT